MGTKRTLQEAWEIMKQASLLSTALTARYGEVLMPVRIDESEKEIVYSIGSALIFCRLIVDKDGEMIIAIYSPVASECKRLDGALLLELLEANESILYGRFSVSINNRTISFSHTLYANTLDIDEFLYALIRIAKYVDSVDEEISKKCGGKRGGDCIS